MEQGRYQAVSTGEHLLVPDLGLVLRSTDMDGVWVNGPFRANQEEDGKGRENKLQVKERKWSTLKKADKLYEGLAIEFKLSEEATWITGFFDSRTSELKLTETPVDCGLKRARATLLGGKLEYHPVTGEPRVLNTTGASALDNSVTGVPMIDLLDTEWVYNPEELGSEGFDRIDEEEGTGTKEPHLAWQVLGVTSISWEVVVNALWEWFTRVVCVWLVIRACWKVPIKMLAKEVETKLRFRKGMDHLYETVNE